MALPPTRIYRYISTPEKTFANLEQAGLLRSDVDEESFLRAMREVEQRFDMPPGMTGPNLMDLTAQELGAFLNEKGQELARTPRYSPEAGDADEEQPPTAKTCFLGVLGVLFAIVFPIVLYLGLLTLLGMRPHPDITWIHYAAGALLTLFTSAVISLVGESLIEDMVKFAFFGGVALAIWGGKATPSAAIVLGIAVGSLMPLLARLVIRWQKRRS